MQSHTETGLGYQPPAIEERQPVEAMLVTETSSPGIGITSAD